MSYTSEYWIDVCFNSPTTNSWLTCADREFEKRLGVLSGKYGPDFQNSYRDQTMISLYVNDSFSDEALTSFLSEFADAKIEYRRLGEIADDQEQITYRVDSENNLVLEDYYEPFWLSSGSLVYKLARLLTRSDQSVRREDLIALEFIVAHYSNTQT